MAYPPQESISLLADLIQAASVEDPLDLASRLIARFGSLRAVLSAPSEQLLPAVGGDDRQATILLAAGRLAETFLADAVGAKPVDRRDPAFVDFIRWHFRDVRRERLVLVYFDRDERLLFAEVVSEGSVCAVETDIRAILRGALQANAASLVLAHNHPSGDFRPSEEDLRNTAIARSLSSKLGVTISDHLIVTPDAIYSMCRGELL